MRKMSSADIPCIEESLFAAEEPVPYGKNDPIHIELTRIRLCRPHFHSSSLEIIYCLEGSLRVHAGYQAPSIHAGEVYSIDCRDIHCLESEEDNLVLIMHLNLSYENRDPLRPGPAEPDSQILQYIYFACESISCQPYQIRPLQWLQEQMLAMACDLAGGTRLLDHKKQYSRILQTLLRFFNFYTYLNHEYYINPDLYDRFYRILIYCHKNYSSKITLANLAEEEHISRNYVSQFLRRSTFTGFNSMLQYIRSYESEILLLTTDMPVAEVGYSCGFSDPKYYYAAFRRFWECTPTQHRRRMRNFLRREEQAEFLPLPESYSLLQQAAVRWLIRDALDLETPLR